jgi:hypothetical protein
MSSDASKRCMQSSLDFVLCQALTWLVPPCLFLHLYSSASAKQLRQAGQREYALGAWARPAGEVRTERIGEISRLFALQPTKNDVLNFRVM